MIFRGTERNKRRGFHNLHVFRSDSLPRTRAAACATSALPPHPARNARRRPTNFDFPALADPARPAAATLYCFAVDGKQLPSSPPSRASAATTSTELSGYQRPEVLAHIAAIRSYLESETPMIPNAIVVAFDSRVRVRARTAT